MRKILSAFAIFAVAGGILAIAEAKKPIKVAVLHKHEQQSSGGLKEPKAKPKPRAKKYLPVADFGDY